MTAALAVFILAAVSRSLPEGQTTSRVPVVLQGQVRSVQEKIVVVESPVAILPNERQVDISAAVYEDSRGRQQAAFSLHVGDRVIVVSDPLAPTTQRAKPGPNGTVTPMYVRLLPLKALVIEKLEVSRT